MPGRHITDCQRRLFLSEQRRTTTEVAAARAGISRASGYRIRGEAGAAPKPRGRRRPDPLASVWESEVVPLLERCPGLRPVAVLDPFVGNGATAMAAEKAGIPWIGLDPSPENCEIVSQRVKELRTQVGV